MLLIGARDDTVVPVSETDEMARALKTQGKAVTLLDLRHGGNSLTRSGERIRALTAIGVFLQRHLQSVGRDFSAAAVAAGRGSNRRDDCPGDSGAPDKTRSGGVCPGAKADSHCSVKMRDRRFPWSSRARMSPVPLRRAVFEGLPRHWADRAA